MANQHLVEVLCVDISERSDDVSKKSFEIEMVPVPVELFFNAAVDIFWIDLDFWVALEKYVVE